jgi:hypothetical protein
MVKNLDGLARLAHLRRFPVTGLAEIEWRDG